MKAVTAIGLLACLVDTADAYGALLFSIGNCARLQEAAAELSNGNVEGLLTVSEITCDEWTDINITQNKLKFIADFDDVYTFKNVRFVVSSDAVLRADVDIKLTGDPETQEVNGGLLSVADGGYARFRESVDFEGSGVTTTDNDDRKHGACIYNEGKVRFEGAFRANGCKNVAVGDGVTPGNGSGLWNGPGANAIFKQTVLMEDCGYPVDGAWSANYGGAIYNEGKVSFYETALFENNGSEAGGAIYNVGEMKFLKRSKATFAHNSSWHSGGHFYNMGSLIMRNKAWFVSGYSGGSGGAIYVRDGSMTFLKRVEFNDNVASAHGGAISTSSDLVHDLPADAVYSGNSILNADYDFHCENVYVNGPEEDGYTCLP